MTISWSMSDADRRLIPSSGLKGPVPLLFAIMLFIMAVAAGAGLAIANLANRVTAGAEYRYSIQLNDGVSRQPVVVAALRTDPDVLRADPIPESELRKTLGQWLGPASADPTLPIPVIIDLDIKPGANPGLVAGRLARIVPGAAIRSHADTLQPLLRPLTWLGWLALALVVLVGMAASAAVVMAARGALDSHRSTIDVMHGIGATDQQIARIFLRQIAGEAFLGGVTGTLAAIAVGFALGYSGTVSSLLTGPALLGWKDLAIIALLPFGATAIATLVARRALMNALGDRL